MAEKNKALVLEAFDTLFNKRDYAAAERYWSPAYIQHSAHIEPGRDGLFNLIKSIPPTLKYEPGEIVAEGDLVIVHGRFSGMGLPVNWIAADIVRIKDGVLVEHWDVIEDEATRESSKSGRPMFGDRFPPAEGLSPGRKMEMARELLKSLETKDPKPFSHINSRKYIQHNLGIGDGPEGVRQLISRLPNSTRVNTVRIFADGDFVAAQSEYDFAGGPKVGFDVFRFEGGEIVEHWDNLEEKCSHLNLSGRSQLDGPTEVVDLDKTESNKDVVKGYFDSVVLHGQRDKVSQYRSMDNFHQHSCDGEDNKSGFQLKTGPFAKPGFVFKIEKVHKILGQGNFVLAMSEGLFDAKPTAFYGLYRLEDHRIVEHWDALEAIPPKEQWKNTNGKF
jgi:predicted SnoaL-like aldol condensation-catalyzing enzyme